MEINNTGRTNMITPRRIAQAWTFLAQNRACAEVFDPDRAESSPKGGAKSQKGGFCHGDG
jgi:hypothetical protein